MGLSMGLMLDGTKRSEMMDEQSVCLLQASLKVHVHHIRRVIGRSRSNYQAPLIVLVLGVAGTGSQMARPFHRRGSRSRNGSDKNRFELELTLFSASLQQKDHFLVQVGGTTRQADEPNKATVRVSKAASGKAVCSSLISPSQLDRITTTGIAMVRSNSDKLSSRNKRPWIVFLPPSSALISSIRTDPCLVTDHRIETLRAQFTLEGTQHC